MKVVPAKYHTASCPLRSCCQTRSAPPSTPRVVSARYLSLEERLHHFTGPVRLLVGAVEQLIDFVTDPTEG